jgi:glycosyltransferase involved in cell wall biosynthesis
VSAGSTEPLVSVVTPFYNTADHLAECVESVLAQGYRNFEYVLVNNCSTDASVEIVERYVRRDSRLRLVHTDRFLTQLQNYNGALQRISPASRYVKMVQADDSIFPQCLEEMVTLAEANPSVGVVSSYRMVGPNPWPKGLPHTKTVMSGRDACRLCLIDNLSLFGSQTTVMLRADLVRARHPFFHEDRFFSDSDVCYEILREADFGFVHQILSFTRIEDESAWGRSLDYRPLVLDRLIRLVSYGPLYLSAEENARITAEHERFYRRLLAEAWLVRREPAFWDYHRKGLQAIGRDINRAQLLRDAVPVVLHYLMRPQTVASRLRTRDRGPYGSA